jgi:tetratricopeptide (TPR) repeat protein
MKRTIDLILRTVAILSLFLIPAGFIISGSELTRALDAALHITVDPRFSGGRVLSKFYDPAGDDHGEGGLTYPKAGKSDMGAFDIISYSVYEPVTDSAGSAAYWQLGVTLAGFANPADAPNGFSLPAIRIYVDTDGPASGSLDTAAARAELVSFDPAAPWDASIAIDGWHSQALLRTADGRVQRRIPLIVITEQRSVYVRLPLDVPEIKRILDGRTTRHYVMICGYDQYAADAVMQVKESPSLGDGGGARSPMTPRVFDLLAAGAGTQEAMLSSYDEKAFRYAEIAPVVSGDGAAAKPAVDFEALAAKADTEARGQSAAESRQLTADAASTDPLTAGAALFRLGKRGEAEAKLKAAIAADPEDPEALAYLGSLKAMEAGASGSPADAVGFVNEAFALFDRAASAAKTDGEREIVLMNRASVADAVPEDVFGKSMTAARDFMALAEMALNRGDGRTAADRYVSAGLAFEKAGSAGEADIAFATAMSQNEISARALLELARRGYPVTAP